MADFFFANHDQNVSPTELHTRREVLHHFQKKLLPMEGGFILRAFSEDLYSDLKWGRHKIESRTCIFFRESLTWRDAVRAVIPRKSP